MPALVNVGNIPRKKTDVLTIRYFGGVDLSNQPSNVDKKRASNGINMIRDVPGKVRKRTGYFIKRKYPDVINGAFEYGDKLIIHAGTKLYIDGDTPTDLGVAVQSVKSDAKQLGGKLWFLDGKTLLVYDGTTMKPASQGAYTPTITIGKSPTGAGTTFEPINLLNPMRSDSFLGTATATAYSLSSSGLSSAAVTAKKLNFSGNWVNMTEGTDFSVNRTTGTVTFTTAPGASPVAGEDNVVITYGVANADYPNRINKCRFGICYGVEGAVDRLFISGNPDYPNYDFYSQLNDPTYFGDLWYGVIGQAHSPIMGYSIINNRLATHKRNDDNDRNIILRYGTLPDGDYSPDEALTSKTIEFKIVDIIQGVGAIANHSFAYTKEPMFMTADGICATTPYEFNSDRYIQNRSVYINMALLKEPGLEDAYACVYEDFYMLAVSGKVYILDTLELSYEKEKTSRYQYESYLWDNVPASIIFTYDGSLYFGDQSGNLMQFFDDAESVSSYLDGVDLSEPYVGQAISARWDFDFSGENFYLNKRIKYIAIRLAPSVLTSVEIYAGIKGAWKTLLTLGGEARYLSFSTLMFSRFSFSGDTNPRTIGKKIKIKKVDSVRFSLRNDQPMEPFGIYEIALEFIEGGYYKG